MMSENPLLTPDYLFETSWEVCNKIGGIYTVISTKALTLAEEFKDNYILIGPDVWKETHRNPEFLEDKFLYQSWRQKAETEGLKIKVGRWNITGNPVVILVDFTQYFPQKDKIFAWLWETYQIDSITGGWDYIEPALFGYAAGKIIESFYNYYISGTDRIVAQFHEWMTGTGVLYLKKFVPQVGTVFTTHATVAGRSIAGIGLPLYRDFEGYDASVISKQFGFVAKHSLEKHTALEADSLTTVSQITDRECRQFLGKNADVITPNGFEDSFVPSRMDFYEKRAHSRVKLIEVAEAMTNQPIDKGSILIINSGRYEFRNKGVDLYIDALGRLNKQARLPRLIVGFIAIPAYQVGPSKKLLQRMVAKDHSQPVISEYCTHDLNEPENDAILKRIRENDLLNRPEDKVKIVFIPAYLNGNDGVVNLPYYDFLIGFDGSIFPSYYEPWGYTPLESLAFHIPTITTSLSGFGQWVRNLFPTVKDSITVIPRGDDNDSFVVEEIVKSVISVMNKSDKDIIKIRLKAHEISQSALWENLISSYHEAFSVATVKANSRSDQFIVKQPQARPPVPVGLIESKPEWKKVLVQQSIPENLQPLSRLAYNLWWTWNQEGIGLFESIDPKRWAELKNNPIALIESLSYTELQALSHNAVFIEKLKAVTDTFDSYMAKSSEKTGDTVAYFSMEFGIHDAIKIFSGGLGMLAGDYLKEASDSNYNMVGVGLLYRYGYFQQLISFSGEQMAVYNPQKFTHMPLFPVRDAENNWMKVTFALPGRTMYAKIWRVDVGRVPLYLLDTDIDENIDADKVITHKLYGGDSENRLRQEILLGIGGIRLIDVLGIHPMVYHSNEGHSAFIGLERLRNLITEDKLTFQQALEVVRASTLFTTHTPVPAGHDTFSEDLLRRYLSHYPDHLNIKWEQFMQLGKMTDSPDEAFSMSVLAAKLSQEVNAVSRIHCRVTREMFRRLYPGYYPSELPIGYVTNGVHLPTWASANWQVLYKEKFGSDFFENQRNLKLWEKIQEVDDEVIWNIRLKQKRALTDYLTLRIYGEMTRRNEDPKMIFRLREAARKDAMTIGFARRFATYKRAHLLFTNLQRLAKIVNTAKKPVRFLFAGKAHPNDKAGQDLIKKIYEISKTPEFMGKILFVENYDIELAHYLIQGVDVWLNTPARPLEASGTSGEKAVMNGVLNFSVLDGWWAEGYKPDAGWALREEPTYENQQFQDELDAEIIYNLLEEEIIPQYYSCNENKIPVKWVSYIKNTISGIAPHFTMKRQLDDYINLFYRKLSERSKVMVLHNYELARHIASWKRNVMRDWNSIQVVSTDIPDSTQKPLVLGDPFKAEIVLDLKDLKGSEIGIEVVFGKKVNDEVNEPILVEEMKLVHTSKSYATYACEIPFHQAGVYDFAFRIFPKNDLLPHRQEFSLVKWI